MKNYVFDATRDFEVKQSPFMNNLIGIILVILFAVSTTFGYGWEILLQTAALFLAPAIFFFFKARSKYVYIRINTIGVYYKGILLMKWEQFKEATLTEEPKLASISDNFIIILKYFSEDRKLIYTKKLPMANTQNKDDEEIIAAINAYYKFYVRQKQGHLPGLSH